MSALTFPPLSPLDPLQRYTIRESAGYLRLSRAQIYKLIRQGDIRILKDGDRTFVPGSELVRKSTLPANATRKSAAA